ncbi:MAG: hypothetical protein B7733_24100 [Myxococcales bacterium FL481]|nr:MAG: hypothetical protein B7733_24100 [Myxococcales bacterium FL481]
MPARSCCFTTTSVRSWASGAASASKSAARKWRRAKPMLSARLRTSSRAKSWPSLARALTSSRHKPGPRSRARAQPTRRPNSAVRPRRSLSSVGGTDTRSHGDPSFAVPLRRALAAQNELRGDELTHGFHSYAARMHPAVARELLHNFRGAGKRVLDPFCGSGTVLVEAMRTGWRALGSDLNPLALALSRVKTQRRDSASVERFTNCLDRVVAGSSRRVRERTPVRARLPPHEFVWYDVHVLKELAGLLEEIRSIDVDDDRLALEMLFSAIVVKFSRQRSDTSVEAVDKRIRKGLATEFFARRGLEWIEGWKALARDLPHPCYRTRVVAADARRLAHTLGADYRCDLVLSSPPYGGTYDYVEHHRRRYAWLDMHPTALRKGEIGARRELSRDQAGARRWDAQVGQFLTAMSQVLHPDGIAVLLVGDAELNGQRMVADRQLQRLAGASGFEFLAAASQPRADRRGGRPRAEHLVALMKR